MTPREALRKYQGLQGKRQRQRQRQARQSARDVLAPLVEELTGADDARRRAAVQAVLQTCQPEVRGLLIDRLVDRLGRHQGGGRVVAALAEFGDPALPALTLAFIRSRAARQHALVGALAVVGRRLGPQQRARLQFELAILHRWAADEAVRLSLAEVAASLRPTTPAPP
jgi:hypothetical protein